MSKDARKQPVLTDETKKKFEECVSAMAACGFGPGGPPVETTFAEIEEFGTRGGEGGGSCSGREVDESARGSFSRYGPLPLLSDRVSRRRGSEHTRCSNAGR